MQMGRQQVLPNVDSINKMHVVSPEPSAGFVPFLIVNKK
jgi:hypothetical protein